jgi:hypothetical protein
MFLSKARVESMWYHESNDFNIVAVDALSRGERYIKAALFCLCEGSTDAAAKATAAASVRAAPMRRLSWGRTGAAGETSPLKNMPRLPSLYSIDIGTNEASRFQLEVSDVPNEIASICLRLWCDVLTRWWSSS